MNNNTNHSSGIDKKLMGQIKLFIEYGIKNQERKLAEDTLKNYGDNHMILGILNEFYSMMPECRDEAVREVSKIVSRQAMYLMSVATENFEYLFFYDGEESFYLGEKKDGIEDSEILNFFGYANNEEFLKQQKGVSLISSSTGEKQEKSFCPACSVEEGEIHQFGCPVETCPWCEGQLNFCNCRFDKLGVEEIFSESELDLLEILLNEKGRIPFSKEEGPSYPEV